MSFVTRLLINALALWITVLLGQKIGIKDLGFESGGQTASAVMATAVMVIVLTLVNSTIGLVVKFLTKPLNCLTLGLFSFVVNALMFMLAGVAVSSLGYGFKVGSFTAGLFGSVVMGIISSIATTLVADPDKDAKKKE